VWKFISFEREIFKKINTPGRARTYDLLIRSRICHKIPRCLPAIRRDSFSVNTPVRTLALDSLAIPSVSHLIPHFWKSCGSSNLPMKRKTTPHTWRDSKGRLYVRFTFTDSEGKRRDVKRRAESATHARELYREMENEHRARGEKPFEAARMTFAELADYFERHYVQPAQYKNDMKVSGLRSVKSAESNLRILRSYFGQKRVREITHGDLKAFKRRRLDAPKPNGEARTFASVNRTLALLRKMLNVALREHWIPYNPFGGGDALISGAEERKRERIITRQEEARMLAACVGRRAHVRPLFVCALDTGMRSGEMFKLVWRDVDFEARRIHIRAFNTKTMRERSVAMTARLERELRELWASSLKTADSTVFGVKTNFKRSWAALCKAAGVTGARPHDLRHTAATRLVQGGMPLPEVARILGHSSITTTYRYVNATEDTAKRAASILDDFHAAAEFEADSVN
jgi:integrase